MGTNKKIRVLVTGATGFLGSNIEAGVNLVACQMTVDLFGYTHDDFIPEVKDWIGAATFLPIAQKSDVCLFI